MTEPDVFAQISRLKLDRAPLIVCDVDEVLLSFIAPLEAYMLSQGFEMVEHTYKLTGNLRRRDGGLATQDEVRALLHGFFDTHTGAQDPVAGAAEALAALAPRAQIVLLTNMPLKYRDGRLAALARHGIAYPLVTNEGPKGPAVAALATRAHVPLIFLDDSPGNVTSVRDHVAGCHLVHFIADPRFFATAAPIDGVHLRANEWAKARAFIEAVLDAGAPVDNLAENS